MEEDKAVTEKYGLKNIKIMTALGEYENGLENIKIMTALEGDYEIIFITLRLLGIFPLKLNKLV